MIRRRFRKYRNQFAKFNQRQFRNANFRRSCAQVFQLPDGPFDACFDLGVEIVKEEIRRNANPQTTEVFLEASPVISNASPKRRRIVFVETRDGLQHHRDIFHTSCHRSQMVQGPCEGNDPVFADETVGRLQPDNAA